MDESNDVLIGGPGDDVLNPRHGSDVTRAGSGNDKFENPEKDLDDVSVHPSERIFMGPGMDQIDYGGVGTRLMPVSVFGGGGRDQIVLDRGGAYTVHAGGGSDVVDVKDGLPTKFVFDGGSLVVDQRDSVDCGRSSGDLVTADKNRERQIRHCERIKY